ncbi:MAG TPA: hypothetical protein VLX59_16755 [Acidimicrobiales bacterium]|nr:hypothetical protein [Acidimicrobiales bacterium]
MSLPRRHSKLLSAGALVLIAVVALGCSSSKKAASSGITTPSTPAASATTAVPATAGATTPASPASGDLSGTWSGNYTGSFSGTFTLTWQQTGSNLSGTIKISGFGDVPTNIDGSVQGSSIRFGTVHGQEVTYTGTVSGASMSGSWQIPVPGHTVKGSWSASKSS